MPTSLLRGVLAATAVTLLGGMGFTAQAAAPTYADFQMSAHNRAAHPFTGNAYAEGRLAMYPHRVVGTVRVDDVCPKDGARASLNIGYWSRGRVIRQQDLEDKFGCKGNGRVFRVDQRFPNRTITAIDLIVRRLDGDRQVGERSRRYIPRKSTGR